MIVSTQPPVIIVTANGVSGNRATAISAEIAKAQGYAERAEIASGALTSLTDRIPFTFSITSANAGRGPYALSYNPGTANMLSVHLNGIYQAPPSVADPVGHYSIVVMPSAPSGKGILFTGDQTVGNRVDLVFVLPLGYNPVLDNSLDYPSIAALNEAIAGGVTRAAGRVVTAGGLAFVSVPGSVIAGLPTGYLPAGDVTLAHWGPNATGGADATVETQNFLNYCAGRKGFMTPGTYRINSALTLPSNAIIHGVRGSTILRQYGQYLFVGPDNLTDLHMSGFTLDYRRVGGNIYDTALSLRAHKNCIFEDFETLRYDDVTILERTPNAAATHNTIDNVFRDWNISACAVLDVAIGLEGYYFNHTGDGVTTVLATNIIWPELFNSSVVVLKETASRVFTELTLTTDYTVTYDGSNKLIVTMAVAPAALERIHIWPSAPRTDLNRRPISNTLFENIRCLYVFKRGHQAVRWVDAETYRFERLLAAADGVFLYVTNPYTTRDGQGGDYGAYEDSILGYQTALVPTPTSLRGFDFGPGSMSMSGRGIRADQPWLLGGTNRLMAYRDGRVFVLTGTVSGTSGTPTVTGVGTLFRDQLTLVGATKDLVKIDGVTYAIASINSNTSLTLATNLTTSPAGAAISRINISAAVGFAMDFASVGNGFYSSGSNQLGRAQRGSVTETSGTAVLLSGATSVVVTHELMRAPLVHEISLVAGSLLQGRSMSISNRTATTFQINISSAAAANYDIGWRCALVELN